MSGSHCPSCCLHEVLLPPQRFSRSRGFAPPDTCRPCFMPVPSMGFFPFRADFTRRAFGSLEPPSPLVVRWFEKCSAPADMEGCTSGCAFHDSCLVKQHFSDQSHFRVLVPTSVCTPHRLFGPMKSHDPRALSSLGVSPSLPGAFLKAHPLLSFIVGVQR